MTDHVENLCRALGKAMKASSVKIVSVILHKLDTAEFKEGYNTALIPKYGETMSEEIGCLLVEFFKTGGRDAHYSSLVGIICEALRLGQGALALSALTVLGKSSARLDGAHILSLEFKHADAILALGVTIEQEYYSLEKNYCKCLRELTEDQIIYLFRTYSEQLKKVTCNVIFIRYLVVDLLKRGAAAVATEVASYSNHGFGHITVLDGVVENIDSLAHTVRYVSSQ